MTESRSEMRARSDEAVEALPRALEAWLSIATENLCQDAKDRIAGEILAHYRDGLDALAGEGSAPEAAQDRVMDDLGDPEKAHKAFSRTYLTSWQAEFLSKLRKRNIDEHRAGGLLDCFTLIILFFLPKDYDLYLEAYPGISSVFRQHTLQLIGVLAYTLFLYILIKIIIHKVLASTEMKRTYSLSGKRYQGFFFLLYKRFPRIASILILPLIVLYCCNLAIAYYFTMNYGGNWMIIGISSLTLPEIIKDSIFVQPRPDSWRQNMYFSGYILFLVLLLFALALFMLDLSGTFDLHLSGVFYLGELDKVFVFLCVLAFSGVILYTITKLSLGMYLLRKGGVAMPAPEPEQEAVSDINTPGCA